MASSNAYSGFINHIQKPKPKKCPNKCGNMVLIMNPAFVPPTEDAMDAISSVWSDEDREIYTFIDWICPKCGFYECRTMSERTFEAWRKSLAYKAQEKEAST